MDKSVDNFAISVDKSAKPVDNFVDNFLAKKVIHRKTDLSTGSGIIPGMQKTSPGE